MLKHKITICIICAVALCLCGCSSGSNEESSIDNEIISDVSVTDKLSKSITELIENYFMALKEHNHQDMLTYTTSDYILNYDQTGFDEFVRYITDYEVDDIDFSNVTEDSDIFTVQIKYTLTYSEKYVGEDDRLGGVYSYYDDFVIQKDNNDEYKISSTEHKGAG